MGGTAEWEALGAEDAAEADEPAAESEDEAVTDLSETGESVVEPQPGTDEISVTRIKSDPDPDADPESESGEEPPTRILEPIPSDQSRDPGQRQAAGNGGARFPRRAATDDWFEEFDEHGDPAREEEMINRDWNDEEARTATLEWPLSPGEARREEAERERIDSPRVRHLFPVPDDADWDVSELEYDRNRRARVS